VSPSWKVIVSAVVSQMGQHQGFVGGSRARVIGMGYSFRGTDREDNFGRLRLFACFATARPPNEFCSERFADPAGASTSKLYLVGIKYFRGGIHRFDFHPGHQANAQCIHHTSGAVHGDSVIVVALLTRHG